MLGRRSGEKLSVAAAGHRLRCAVCGLFALAATGCSLLFSAPSSDCGGKSCDSCARDASCCSSGWSLTDDFDGDQLSELRWVVLFGGDDVASLQGGSLFLTAPSSVTTVGIASRSALRLDGSSGRSVSVHMPAHRPALRSNVILQGLSGARYMFHLDEEISPTGPSHTGGAPIAYEDAPYLRFEPDGNLMHWKTSTDGQSWVDAYFEPWVNEPVWLVFETYGQAAVSAEPLEVLGINEQIDDASPPCSVALLHDDFEGPVAESTVANRWHVCHEISGGELVLPDGCGVETALTYSLVEASVSVDVVSSAGSAEFAVLLADGSEISLAWDEEGLDLWTEGGILGHADQEPDAVRFRHHDGELLGEHLLSGKWEVVGRLGVTTDLVSTVQLAFAGWAGGGVRFDDLSGSSP